MKTLTRLLIVTLAVWLSACGTATPTAPADTAEDGVVAATSAPADTDAVGDSTSAEAVSNESAASVFPVTVTSCGEAFTYEQAPERMVVYDVNMIELSLALGLEAQIAGYWTGGSEVREQFKPAFDTLTAVSEESWPPPALEPTLGANPDFVFSGWGYGFSEEGGLTPAALKAAGVNSYAIRESCVKAGVPEPITIEDTYEDILNIGRIFGVSDRAQALVDEMSTQVKDAQAKVGTVVQPLRVFFYDSGEDKPYTAGQYGMPTALMAAVGGENIMADVPKDWANVSWEEVINRNPEVIVVLNSSWVSSDERIAFLKSKPELADIDAIKNERFVVLTYRQAVPGLLNGEAIQILAEGFYPDKFE